MMQLCKISKELFYKGVLLVSLIMSQSADSFSVRQPMTISRYSCNSRSSCVSKILLSGKASSNEEDLDLTRDAIMKHANRIDDQSESEGSQIDANKSSEGQPSSQTSELKEKKIDQILARATAGFPVFVMSAAIIGLTHPSKLTWVNRGEIIPFMLASVMLSMGMTLQAEDFARVLSKTPASNSETKSPLTAIPAGIACQYIIMPLAALLFGSVILLPVHPAAFLGLILVGCAPGGTASNLVSLIAGADVALSVVLTSISTVFASALTPLLVRSLAGRGDIAVSGWVLCKTTARVVLCPVAIGMLIREKWPESANFIGRFAPFLGVILVALMCGGVVAQNAATVLVEGCANSLLLRIISAVLCLHSVGFFAGYFFSKKLFGLSEKASRTISIETGMQNSALAVVLARSLGNSIGANSLALACLPGAFSATAHSCLGSVLAVYWRCVDGPRKDNS